MKPITLYSNIKKDGVIKPEPADPIKDTGDIARLIEHFYQKGHVRDATLFIFGATTLLRCSDLLRFRWADILDGDGHYLDEIVMTEQKTGRKNYIFINEDLKGALDVYRAYLGDRWAKNAYLFESQRFGQPLTVRSVGRIVKMAARAIDLAGNYSSHTMRKTGSYSLYKQNVRIPELSLMLNHTSERKTIFYLGINRERKQALNRQIKIK